MLVRILTVITLDILILPHVIMLRNAEETSDLTAQNIYVSRC